jgi:hypothetical protein
MHPVVASMRRTAPHARIIGALYQPARAPVPTVPSPTIHRRGCGSKRRDLAEELRFRPVSRYSGPIMGFFDKVKKFVGGKNTATVTITSINGMAPTDAVIAISDGTVRGSMTVTAQQDCTMLAMKYDVLLRTQNEQGKWGDISVGSGKDVARPVQMTTGQVITQDWVIHGVDVETYLRNQSYDDMGAVVSHPKVKLVVLCTADVEGSPFDPNAEAEVRIGPSTVGPCKIETTVIEGRARRPRLVPGHRQRLQRHRRRHRQGPVRARVDPLRAVPRAADPGRSGRRGRRPRPAPGDQVERRRPARHARQLRRHQHHLPAPTRTRRQGDPDMDGHRRRHPRRSWPRTASPDPHAAVNDPNVKLVVRTYADVESGGVSTGRAEVTMT